MRQEDMATEYGKEDKNIPCELCSFQKQIKQDSGTE